MNLKQLLSCTILVGTIVFAQETPPPATGGGPTTGGNTPPNTGVNTGGNAGGNAGAGGLPGNNPRNPSSFPQERQQNIDQMQNRPIFISGKVRMDDGSAPPETVTIERVCASRGTPVPEAYTDSKGGFSFQVGQRMGMMPDASIGNTNEGGPGGGFGSGFPNQGGRNSGGVSERDLMSCELRASLPGYRSTIVSLVGRRSLDNPDVGTIILRRLGDVTGFTTSATSLMAPKDAKKSLEKARNALKKNKLPEAQKELETAVSLHPKYAEAWYELGRVQVIQTNADAARNSYGKALEADDKYVRPYLGLAVLEAQQQKWESVKQLSEKVIKLNRHDFPAAFFYGAVANYNLRDSEAAEKLCRSGIEIDQYHSLPKMSHLLGMILVDKQDFKGASEQLGAYLKFAPKAGDIDQVKKQLADIDGKVAKTTP